jgi:hypothetical protein
MERWYELEQIISSVVYNDDCDSLIWNYNTDGKYSSSSMYKIISFRGVVPLYIPSFSLVFDCASKNLHFPLVVFKKQAYD